MQLELGLVRLGAKEGVEIFVSWPLESSPFGTLDFLWQFVSSDGSAPGGTVGSVCNHQEQASTPYFLVYHDKIFKDTQLKRLFSIISFVVLKTGLKVASAVGGNCRLVPLGLLVGPGALAGGGALVIGLFLARL